MGILGDIFNQEIKTAKKTTMLGKRAFSWFKSPEEKFNALSHELALKEMKAASQGRTKQLKKGESSMGLLGGAGLAGAGVAGGFGAKAYLDSKAKNQNMGLANPSSIY